MNSGLDAVVHALGMHMGVPGSVTRAGRVIDAELAGTIQAVRNASPPRHVLCVEPGYLPITEPEAIPVAQLPAPVTSSHQSGVFAKQQCGPAVPSHRTGVPRHQNESSTVLRVCSWP